MEHKILKDARKMILAHLARRRLKALAKRRGLSESLLRKIAKGKRKVTFRVAEILIHGYYDPMQLDQDLAVTMTLRYDADGAPRLVSAENNLATDL